jgi:hypothetical protein
MGVAGGAGELYPTYTLMQVQNGVPDASNLVGLDPLVKAEYDSSVRVFPWRGNPNFVGADIVALELPVTLLGNYHLGVLSPARDAGVTSVDVNGVPFNAPGDDYDRQARSDPYDLGADEASTTFLYLPTVARIDMPVLSDLPGETDGTSIADSGDSTVSW